MKPAQIVIGVVIALALAGGGFAAGMSVGKGSAEAAASASPTGAAGRTGVTGRVGQGGAGGSGAFGGGQAMTGRILSVNDGSITIEVRQGGGGQGASPTVTSQIVLIGSTTRIVKTVESDIKLTDLKTNDQVTIVGTTDASGNLAATAIVAGGNALGGLFGGPGGRGASPSPSPSAKP